MNEVTTSLALIIIYCYIQFVPIKHNPLEIILYVSEDSRVFSQTFGM